MIIRSISARKADKFRANVQWYSKPQRIPKSIDTDHMDDEYEVVEEYRKFDSDVSVESIYRKCRVSWMKNFSIFSVEIK